MFDSNKDMQSKISEQRPGIFVKLSLRDLCDSKSSSLSPFDKMAF